MKKMKQKKKAMRENIEKLNIKQPQTTTSDNVFNKDYKQTKLALAK